MLVFIAENIKKNVRQLEGAVNKVTAYRDLMDGELTVSSVAQIIRDMLKVEAPAPEAIIRETAKYYSVDPEEMCGQRRTKNIAHARKVAMYLMRRLTDLTLNEIGKVFGGRDHATVLAALHGMEELVNKSSELSQTLKDITANINSAEK